MLSFLGGKSHSAFGQQAFSIAGNRMTTVTLKKVGFLNSLACLDISEV